MTTQIALIRGINVGSSKRVAMAALREMLSGLGYADVRTHLNSGNAVFSTNDTAAAAAAAIEKGLADDLGVPASVLIRTVDQVAAAIEADPLQSMAVDGSKHFLGFLAQKPARGVADKIPELAQDADTAPDAVRLIDDHLYLWCPNGILKATFSKVNWDRRLNTAVTMRNWNTVVKLVEIAGR